MALDLCTDRPLILVTSDDGIRSPGLRAAVRAVLDLGDVIVSAPREQQSGAGRSLAGFNDGAIHEVAYSVDGHQVPAFAIHGSPSQAVMYALLELIDRRPALCISGINFGENVGTRITASGTVGAAMEAADAGVPALAVSLETDAKYHFVHTDVIDFSVATHFVRAFAARLLARSLPWDVDLLKVDIPCDATPKTGWRVCRLSRQRYYRALPSGRRHLTEERRLEYRIEVNPTTLEPDSDVYALCVDRIIAVTPVSLDLTSRVSLDEVDSLLR
jgi:5'/3'-nucleotidase